MSKGPHISISDKFVVNRVLRINIDDFVEWPASVAELATKIALELFLVVYNPFVNVQSVKKSVDTRWKDAMPSLAHHYATSIGEGITLFWSAYDAESSFRNELITKLQSVLPVECILTRKSALIEASTDATDLRMELPILVVEPATTEQVSELVKVANEMKFALIPRGGGSGMTGGAVPARKRTVIVNLTRLTKMKVDHENKILDCEAGVITQNAIDYANARNFLFTVDPASKTASTIGGNVAENSGGPFAFEYGTTLDNLLSWKMVTPTGEIITVNRVNHPRHKILEHEIAKFEVRDQSGGMRSVIELKGDEIRLPGLGKDVTNKALGGLPGMQKEGVDGIITESKFILYDKPKFTRVLCLEFYGRSMLPASVLIGKLVDLRNVIRENGDYAHLSALEEFNSKYVQAINYQKKSDVHEGSPCSVIIVQVDGDDEYLLDSAVQEILELAKDDKEIAIFAAKDDKEAEIFWEDRHKLSAISKRTSGFKINEDVVIPLNTMPDFARFLETLNVELAATAYRYALQKVGRLEGFPFEDKDLNKEFSFCSKVVLGVDIPEDLLDEELAMRAILFLDTLKSKYPRLEKKIDEISSYMQSSRVIVASHMHAGDGNCHVNIPVNSNDPHMMHEAEEVAVRVMKKAQEMGGEVSGEHGIGITKINFFAQEKMDALKDFKALVDPRDIMNPAKLVQRELPVKPFTFSFNRLIEDIRDSGLADKERLIHLLETVQICTRCGKCKHVCPMVYAEKSYHYHPRNKNIVLGAITEAIYYSQITQGNPSKDLLAELRHLIEHCTGCGRCTSVCPVKITSGDVALALRAFLEDENAGGHPIKHQVLDYLSKDPAKRVPQIAKVAAVGQKVQNKFIGLVPKVWRERFESPLFSNKGPEMGITNLYEELRLDKGGIFTPANPAKNENGQLKAVFYFPGCGGSLFSRKIALSSIALMLKTGYTVVVPERHLCCGYPLISSGADGNYKENLERNKVAIKEYLEKATKSNLDITKMITACGSCRDSIERHELSYNAKELELEDCVQFLVDKLNIKHTLEGKHYLYHTSCHPEWSGVKAVKGGAKAAKALEKLTGATITINTGCCGESGTGAFSSPKIYNAIRERKMNKLQPLLGEYDKNLPIVVGCPSCKIGVARTLINLKDKREVVHSGEWLADSLLEKNWQQSFRTQALKINNEGVRIIDMDA